MIRPRARDLARAGLGLAVAATVAAAQPNLSADQAFDRGRKLLAAGDRDGACAAFREAERLRPSTGVELNLAPCLEADGQLVASAAMLGQARQRAAADGQTARVEHADRELARLTALIPTIALDGAEPVALVIDGATVEELTAPAPLDPGVHVVRARWADGATLERSVTLAAGDRLVLAPPAIVAAPVVVSEPPRPRAARRSRSRALPIAVTGAGIALAAVGTGLLVVAYGHDADARAACPMPAACPDDASRHAADRANQLAVRDARLGAVALAGAGATLAVATWLWMRPGPRDRAQPSLALSSDQVAVTLGGSF